MANSHDRAAKLVARKLRGRYNPQTSPDVKGKGGRAEVKSSASEIPEALRQLGGGSGVPPLWCYRNHNIRRLWNVWQV